jgi:signal transduction histidine kinase
MTIDPIPSALPEHSTFEPQFAEKHTKILIVDDEASVRGIFVACLSEQYECVESESVMDALARLSETEFAVVIADVLLPGLSGTELLRKIIESHPHTAVIMVSGINQPNRALDAVRLGAFDYLIKPVDLGVLDLTVERALQRRALSLNAKRYKSELEARVRDLAAQKEELERLQSEIIHNKKMASLGQLAAGVAHELNNPAGFIYGNMDLLHQYLDELKTLLTSYDKIDLPSDENTKLLEIKTKIDYENTIEDLGSIITDCREGAKRIKEIAQNLRVFTRLDEAEFQKTDIHEGIDSTVRLLSSYFSADHINLKRDYGDLPLIDAFPGQLNQVWMNLLVNAAQALGVGGGEVTVSTTRQGESISIGISDTGPGIAPDVLDRIFDPFFTTKEVGEGTGLGLSICFSIVERHGGTIRAYSRPREGTTFTVTLPIEAESPPEIPDNAQTH